MRIALISLNYAPEITGIGLYSGELAQSLATKGHDVHVICSYPFYPEWQRHPTFAERGWSVRSEQGVTVYRCPCYIPANATGARRIFHYISFMLASLKPALSIWRKARPDLVFSVAPALLAAITAIILAKASRAKSWLHIQDFEVEAGFATGQISAAGIPARLALWLERRIFRRFDRISSISPEMRCKVLERSIPAARVTELRNWAGIDRITPQTHSSYRDEWGIKSEHVALYSGSIARKQGIETIIDAARIMAQRTDLTFVVCGNGPTRGELEKLAAGLHNILFCDLQPMDRLNELLNLATVHLLPQKRDAADLVLPSKLANMLASGRPVVAGVESDRGLAREVEGAGLIFRPEDGPSMAAAIKRLIEDKNLYANCSEKARQLAEARWSKNAIIGIAENEMRALVANESLTATSESMGCAE